MSVKPTIIFTTLLAAFTLACSSNTPATSTAEPAAGESGMAAKTATADLKKGDGTDVGTAHLTEENGGVHLQLDASNLDPGTHAIHIHESGVCTAPDFTSAGGHYNPTNKEHGFDSANGPHLGDMRNFDVGQDGKATIDQTINGVSLGSNEYSIAGKAIVIHAGADDYKSQPAGNAGARAACGVINAGM